MTISHFGLLETLTALLSFSNGVLGGGFISCTSQGIPFSSGQYAGNIPAHIAQFDAGDGRGDYYGQELIGDCVEEINHSDGGQSFHCDNGEWISATFWITPDQCLNIEVDDNHYWCCGETPNTGGDAGCGF
ncbi:hypothetical protein N7478_006831 [Penicillium angulare]|uniref:uncharacterized protein n=1 Tax=Penicillium angulare TaxID=116970 RepID=UPI002541ECF8|nr:uncharacterized protein N7478_006831 [Penicillium angulare]KAJ5281459.1 hypothetical protein N7478_006831 [Penicillium angulare]